MLPPQFQRYLTFSTFCYLHETGFFFRQIPRSVRANLMNWKKFASRKMALTGSTVNQGAFVLAPITQINAMLKPSLIKRSVVITLYNRPTFSNYSIRKCLRLIISPVREFNRRYISIVMLIDIPRS